MSPQVSADARGPIPVGYLAGISYCGSTMIAFVLNAHPRILSIGEAGPRYVADRTGFLCSCGVDTTECSFYTEVRDRMSREGVPFDVTNMFLQPRYSKHRWIERCLRVQIPLPLQTVRDALRDNLPPFRGRLAEYVRRNEAFIRAALDVAGKSVFLDGTKMPQRIPFLQRLDVDLRVVHVVRDPRGYAYSARRHRDISPEQAARDWVEGHRAVPRHGRDLTPERLLRVRYEDVCRDPAARLSELSEYLGAGPFELPERLDLHAHHVIGNKGRLSGSRRQSIRLEEKWRDALSDREQAAIWGIAGSLAREYGYER